MSYCRFSTPKCDVYAYESVGDFWQIYVASHRHRLWYDLWLWINAKRIKVEGVKKPVLLHRRYLFSLPHWVTHKKIRIKLETDSFAEGTIRDFYSRMLWLKRKGYRIPEYVLENILMECIDLDNSQNSGKERKNIN